MSVLNFTAGESIKPGDAVCVSEETGRLKLCGADDFRLFTARVHCNTSETISVRVELHPDLSPRQTQDVISHHALSDTIWKLTTQNMHYIAELDAAANRALEGIKNV